MLIMFILIFSVAACSNSTSGELRGNSNGNSSNGGLAAIQGDWIYYTNDADGEKIYKIKLYLCMLNKDWETFYNLSVIYH